MEIRIVATPLTNWPFNVLGHKVNELFIIDFGSSLHKLDSIISVNVSRNVFETKILILIKELTDPGLFLID